MLHQLGLDLMRCRAFATSPSQRFVRIAVVYREDKLSTLLGVEGRPIGQWPEGD